MACVASVPSRRRKPRMSVILAGRRSLCGTQPPDLASSCTSAHPLWGLKKPRWHHGSHALRAVVLRNGRWRFFYCSSIKYGVTTIMLDLAFIRNHPDIVKEAARVKYNPIDIDYLLEVDRQVLELQRHIEEARAEQNKISKRIREAGKDKAQRDALIAEGKLLAEQIKAM